MDKPKATSYDYGLAYQQKQADKYRNRANNHWQGRIDLAHELISEYMLPRLKSKALSEITLVDAGCSIGTFAIEFARTGYRTYGIDFDPRAIEIAAQLASEEGVTTQFVCGDISNWGAEFPPIDIAICFDIFEHLHDDELGSFLTSIRKQLSPNGGLVFHTFPTQWDYIFYPIPLLSLPLLPFVFTPPRIFNTLVKSYAAFVDIVHLFARGTTYREHIKTAPHCNPTTPERLKDIFNRAGYQQVILRIGQLYQLVPMVQKLYSRQPISFRNIYGIAFPA